MSPPIALRLAALALLVVLARAQTSSARVDVATRAAGRPANAANPATVVAARPSNVETPSNASSRLFSPFYWGPQGYVIGPSWFGAGLGGGNWRPIPNHTPFGPPGYNQTEAPVASSGDPCVFENFDCSVYTCRLGVTNTSQSTLEIFEDETGNYVARQRCFLLLDDFDAYGCRQWDRLKLDKTKTSEGPNEERGTVRLRDAAGSGPDGDVDERHPSPQVQARVREGADAGGARAVGSVRCLRGSVQKRQVLNEKLLFP